MLMYMDVSKRKSNDRISSILSPAFSPYCLRGIRAVLVFGGRLFLLINQNRIPSMNDTLQFPLPLLAYLSTPNDRLESIITYATISTGLHRAKSLSADQIAQELAGVTLPKCSSRFNYEDLKAIALGCKFCGIEPPRSAEVTTQRWQRYQNAESFLSSWKCLGSTAPWTRVPKSMVFEARDGSEKTYIRFTALAAINAAIGSKPFAIVTRNRVRAGMLGYASGKLLFDDDGNVTPGGKKLLKARGDKREPITTDQVRTLFDSLVKGGLLHRFQPYRGSVTYYSKTHSAEMIGELVLARVKRSAANQRAMEIGDKIRRIRNGEPLLSGDMENPPHNTGAPHNSEIPTQAPPKPRLCPTQAPHNAALNAALNAAKNAEENAEGKRAISEEERIQYAGMFENLRRELQTQSEVPPNAEF
jgi:hypothetical protein